MSDNSAVQLSDGVLALAVSDPAAGAALDSEALQAGAEALRAAARGETEVGAILLRGTDTNFCAGGNVRHFAGAEHRPSYLRELADTFHAFVLNLYEVGVPVVAAVNGWAAGAGMSLVCHADLAVGGTSTRMRPAYSGIGLSPDGGVTWALPRIIGLGRARRVLLENEIIEATTALDWGLLAEVVADDAVATTAAETAARIAAGPRGALGNTKRLVDDSLSVSLADALYAEGRSISALSGTPEGIEGVDAFIEKRRPHFGQFH